MRKTLLVLVLLLPGLLWAQQDNGQGKDKGVHNGPPTKIVGQTHNNVHVVTNVDNDLKVLNTNSATAINTNSNEATGGTAYGGDAAATQTQNAQGGQANNAGNSQTTSFHQVRQAPLAYAPEAYPSAPCRVASSAGVSSPVGAVALGGSKLDDECDKRETARAFFLVGAREAGLKVLCNTKAAKDALGVDCLKISTKPPEAARE